MKVQITRAARHAEACIQDKHMCRNFVPQVGRGRIIEGGAYNRTSSVFVLYDTLYCVV